MIAGIGNIYADEILHGARLHPERVAGVAAPPGGASRSTTSMHGILEAAVGAGGSTLGDAQYVDLMGSGGSYQDDHRVYGRAGRALRDVRPRRDPPHRRPPAARRTTARGASACPSWG